MNLIERYEEFVAAENWNGAFAIAREIADSAPHVPTAWFNLGVCLDQLGRHFDAAKAFQSVLEIEFHDEGARYRMLRSLYLAKQLETIVLELESIASTMPSFIDELSTVEPFVELFEQNPMFAKFRQLPASCVPESIRHANEGTLLGIGFEATEWAQARTRQHGNVLRPLQEIANRTLAIQCVCLFVGDFDDDASESDIRACLAANGVEECLVQEESSMLSFSRPDAQESFSMYAGWFAERLLPLAWIMGLEADLAPDGSPISDECFGELCRFLGSPSSSSTLGDWLQRYSEPRAIEEIAAMEDLYYHAQVAVQCARGGELNAVPANFDPVFNGGVVLERWHSLLWALTPRMSWSQD